jgi:hypothetical protein
LIIGKKALLQTGKKRAGPRSASAQIVVPKVAIRKNVFDDCHWQGAGMKLVLTNIGNPGTC